MKKLRKAIALLLGMVMALSLMPQMVMAEKTDDSYMYGWYISGPEQNDNIKAYIDGNDSVSGSNSLYIQKNDQNWSDFSVDQNVTIPAGTYTLSLWVKGGYEDATTVLLEGGHWQTHRLLNSEYTTGTEFTRTEGENGWAKLEKTLTVDSENSRIRILTVGWANGFYVDDVRLVKEGTTDNLISNGSFDMRTAPYTADLEAYYQSWTRWDNGAAPNGVTRYASVTDEIAHSGNNSLIVKHQTSEGGMMVVQEGLNLTGTYTLSFWSIGLKSGKQIYVMQGQDGLWQGVALVGNDAIETEKDGEWTKYTLELTVPEGHTQTGMVLCSDGETEGWYLDDISIVPQGSTTNVIKNSSFDFDKVADYTAEFEEYYQGWGNWSAASLDNVNTFYCVTDEIAHSGNNSVVIKHTDGNQNWSAVTLVQEGLSYGAGTYTFSFWAAGNYSNSTCGMTTNGDWWDDFYLQDFTVVEKDGDWTKYSVEFTVPEGKTQNALTVMSNGDTQCLYLDDISLVKTGTTSNLLTNASFEEKAGGEEPEIPTGPKYTTALADYFYSWNDWSAVERDGNLVFLCVTDEAAHSGNHSFVLRHVDASKPSNICIAQNVSSLVAGEYTISFWSMGVKNNGLQAVTLADPWKRYPLEQFTVTETDGDWSKYELTVTADGGETALTFPTDGGTEGWFIDDISLVKVGTTNNLIKNAGFEFDRKPEYKAELDPYFNGWEKEYNVTENGESVFTSVTDEISHSGKYSAVLKHEDSSQYERDLIIKQTGLGLGEGEYTLSFWAAGTVATKVDDAYRWQQIIWLPGVAPDYHYITNMTISEPYGDWSKYTMDFTVPAGTTVNEMKISSRGWAAGLYLDDFSLEAMGDNTNLLKNGSFEIDGSPEYTTEFDAYMTGWSDWSAEAKDGNLTFLCVTNEAAHSGNHSFVIRHVDGSKPSNLCLAQNVPSLEAGEYTISFWSMGVKNNGLQAVTLADPWKRYPLEQFTVTETDGDWSKYELTVTADGGETALTFPTDGGTEGWFIDDISLVKVGTTNNLVSNGSFELKSLNGYYISTPKVVNAGGKELTALEAGKLEVSVEIANYSMGDDFAPIMFVALYDGGRLKTVEYAQQSTSESQLEGFLEDELCFSVNVPEMTEDTDYQLKVMCWESMTGLNPLMDVLGLE